MGACAAVGAVASHPHPLPRKQSPPLATGSGGSQLPLLRTARAGPISPLEISPKPVAENTYKRPAPSCLSGTDSVEPLMLRRPMPASHQDQAKARLPLPHLCFVLPLSCLPHPVDVLPEEDSPHSPDKSHAPESLSQGASREPRRRLTPILLMRKLRCQEAVADPDSYSRETS